MNKSIVIGVGGTGLDAVRALRKLIIENHGSLEAEAMVNLGFLYLDTDPSSIKVSKDNRGKWEVLGKSTALSPAEYKIMSAPDIGSVVKDIDSYPQIKEWLPLDDLDSINKSSKDTPGASQIRPLGRFIFVMSSGEVETAFKNVLNKVPQARQGGDTDVYIVCSLSGGTGSGMFLDLAYKIREWTAGNCKLHAFLVLPELTTSRGIRYTVNAYAALLELNYFSNCNSIVNCNGQEKIIEFKIPGKTVGQKVTPFETCYLVGPRNNAGVELDLGAIPSMIAHRIYLNFDSSFSDAAKGLLNNGKFERTKMLVDTFTGNFQSRNFFTFGLSSIQYPIDQFLEIFSYKLSKALVEEWHKTKDFPGDINARAQGYLPILKLTDDYILGNKDFFGNKHFDNFDVEIDNTVNTLKLKYPEKNIAPYLNDQMGQKESTFRGVGVAEFYKNKRNDLNGALREVQKVVSKKISSDLINPELGFDFCDKILAEMIRIFKEKHKLFVDTFNGLPVKEKNSRASLNGFLNEITKVENQTIPFGKDKKIKDCMNKISEAMKANLSAKIGLKAYEFGIAFISRLIEDLETQKENIKNWHDAIEKIKNDLEAEITKRIASVQKTIENVREFNGTLLFSESKLEEIYHNLDIKSALNYIENEILKDLEGGAIEIPYSTNFSLDAFYKSALSWLQNVSVFRISESNVTDKLLEDYQDETYRRDLISQNFNKSFPFITIDQAELAKGFGEERYSFSSGTTYARLVGILNSETDKSTSVDKVINDLKRATVDVQIESISDRHQILFLQESTAFPLRVIRELKTLKEQYDDYYKNQKPLPLHISKSFNPPLMPLFLTTAEEIKEIHRAEENFILARALKRLTLEENAMQGRTEVRFRYIEYGTEKIATLGNSWEEAFDKLLKDDPETARNRELLNKDIVALMKSYDTKAKRDEIWFVLDDTMKSIRDGLDYKEENPLYKKYNDIRGRIARNYSLYDEGNPPKRIAGSEETAPEMVSTKKPIKSEIRREQLTPDEEKFTNMVRTTLRNSKDGSLSAVMENMLKSNQKKYGITDERYTQILEGIKSELFGTNKHSEYKELFEAFFEDGEISEDERAILIERQSELGITDEETQSIEQSVKSRRA